jgi:hypothetical protein
MFSGNFLTGRLREELALSRHRGPAFQGPQPFVAVPQTMVVNSSPCTMAILAMLGHGQDARGTVSRRSFKLNTCQELDESDLLQRRRHHRFAP